MGRRAGGAAVRWGGGPVGGVPWCVPVGVAWWRRAVHAVGLRPGGPRWGRMPWCVPVGGVAAACWWERRAVVRAGGGGVACRVPAGRCGAACCGRASPGLGDERRAFGGGANSRVQIRWVWGVHARDWLTLQSHTTRPSARPRAGQGLLAGLRVAWGCSALAGEVEGGIEKVGS